jgi:hypothetical protein
MTSSAQPSGAVVDLPSAPPAAPGGELPGGPTAATPPAPFAPTRRPRHLRPGIAAAVGVGVVAAVVILSLVATGVIPIFPAHGGGPETYSQAYALASANASRFPGGPWKALAAIGSAPAVAESLPVNSSLLGAPAGAGLACTPTLLLANGSAISVAPFHGNLSAGLASAWLLVFASSGGTLLFVLDNAGSVEPVATVTCPALALVLAFLTPISGSISSPAVAAAAWTDGGAAFASAHPTTNLVMALSAPTNLGVGLPTSANYTVGYEDCTAAADASHAPGLAAVVSVDAATLQGGSVVNENVTCGNGLASLTVPPTPPVGVPPSSTPLASALSLGTPVLARAPTNVAYPPCGASDYCYTVPVASVSTTSVEPLDLGLQVNTSAGVGWFETNGTGGVAIEDVTGNLVAEGGSVIPTGTLFAVFGWIPDSARGYSLTSALTVGMSFVIDMGSSDPAGHGFVLELVGTNSFSGTLSVPLP